MTMQLEERTIDCPYCGEQIGILIDMSVPEQNYIEDCQVCCRPITIKVGIETDGNAGIFAMSENE